MSVVDGKLRDERDGVAEAGVPAGAVPGLHEQRTLTHNGRQGRWFSEFDHPDAPPVVAYVCEQTDIVARVLRGDQEITPLLATVRPLRADWHQLDISDRPDLRRKNGELVCTVGHVTARFDPQHQFRLKALSYLDRGGSVRCETTFEYAGRWKQGEIVPSGWQTKNFHSNGALLRWQRCKVETVEFLPEVE